jgi:peptidylprolyl isomerase
LNAAKLLALTTLAGSLGLIAQTAPAPASAAPVHHHVVPRKAHPAARAADSSPQLPPGVPPAPGKLETAFALRYIDAKLGEGDPVQPGEFITVHYTGWLASNGTKFDSSYDRNAPFTFPQGMHRVITGWDQGFAGMRPGGKRRLFIPYQLAYGDGGRPPAIPPKSDLIFDIELISASATQPQPPAPAPVTNDHAAPPQ